MTSRKESKHLADPQYRFPRRTHVMGENKTMNYDARQSSNTHERVYNQEAHVRELNLQ